MKTKLLLLLFAFSIVIASCSTSREGCAGARYQGPKYKSYKFSW